jgi:hypothetical protein
MRAMPPQKAKHDSAPELFAVVFGAGKPAFPPCLAGIAAVNPWMLA